MDVNHDHGTGMDELSDDALTDRVRVLQRRRGHRYSFDDVATAYVALHAARTPRDDFPPVRSYLDLGCGLGSVLLMVADRLPSARALGLEAQDVSFELARRNVARNGLGERVQVVHGDLRDPTSLERVRALACHTPGSARFDLITGTPPYKPVGTATPSPDSQRAHARMELRGGVEDYLAAAASLLAATGRCVVCMESCAESRVHEGARRSRLQVREVLPVVPMAGRKGRLFSVFTLEHARAGTGERHALLPEALVLRDANGACTEAARNLRRAFGLESTPDEPASPTVRVRGQSLHAPDREAS